MFLAGGIVAGTGIGAIIRGSLTVVISTASPDDRAGALATFFTAGYAGVSLPVVGVGIILQHLSPRVTLLIFAAAVGLVILAAAPILTRPQKTAGPRPAGPDQPAGTTANDARRHRARHVHGRAVYRSWHAGIDTGELHGDPLPRPCLARRAPLNPLGRPAAT